MLYAIISTSLSPESKSRILAQTAAGLLLKDGHEIDFIDLRDHALPLCDGGAAYGHPAVTGLTERIKRADGIVLAIPIYNYAAGATVKNLLELTGSSFNNKIVGVVAAAGGRLAYMAPISLMNSLMSDFRCIVLPRYVYATADAFKGEILSDAEIQKRLEEFARSLSEVCGAISEFKFRKSEKYAVVA